jgi:DNA/RNA endonuclease YhcR with UshA esterase domain
VNFFPPADTLTFVELKDSAAFALNIQHPDTANATSVDVQVITGASTAIPGTDYSFSSPQTVTFAAGMMANQPFKIDLLDDMIQDSTKLLKLALGNPSMGARTGRYDTLVIKITDDEQVPRYPIDSITTVDAQGQPDSSGNTYGITGTVHGVNLQGSGLSFTMIDTTGGIRIFSFSNPFNYSVQEGDSLFVVGDITSFNGLLEMEPESITLLGQNQPLKQPMKVASLGEMTENELIRMDSVYLADTTQWQTSGSFNVDITDGTDTFTVRINDQTNIPGLPTPHNTYNITGLGGQFDFSAPYNTGYQLLPRYRADLQPVGGRPTAGFAGMMDTIVVKEGADDSINVAVALQNPDPTFATSVQLHLASSGNTAANGSDFSFAGPDTASFPAGSSLNDTITFALTDDQLPESPESFSLVLKYASAGDSIDQQRDSIAVKILDNDSAAGGSVAACSQPFISEYIEGSSLNKAVELYNPAAQPIFLGNYQLERYTNGSATASATINFTDSLGADSTYVIANGGANASILAEADLTTGNIIHNGNDAYALIDTVTGDTLDIFGVVGQDPGSSWSVGAASTQNQTLVRADTVRRGTKSWPLSQTQWLSFPSNTSDSLGQHSSHCHPQRVFAFGNMNDTLQAQEGTTDSVAVVIDLQNKDTLSADSVELRVSSLQTTAAAGQDYNLTAPQTISFALNDTTPDTVQVAILQDGQPEPAEYLRLFLQQPSAGTSLGAFDSLTIRIADDDTNTTGFFFSMQPDTATFTEGTDDSLRVQVGIINPDTSSASSVDLALAPTLPGPQTATAGTDFGFSGSQTITFPAGDTSTKELAFPLIDDAIVEQTEYLRFNLTNPSSGAVLVQPDSAVLAIADNDTVTPEYPIGTINTVDSLGQADSAGLTCYVEGIVTSDDFRAGPGLDFYLQDTTGGINVFSFSNVAGYSVSRGDTLRILGQVGQFRGEQELQPDTIIVKNSGNALPAPQNVAALDEGTESELVRLSSVYPVDTTQWDTTGGGFNADYTNGTDTFDIRIESATDLTNLPAPNDTVDLVGIGSQFKFSAPFTSGYQLKLRDSRDVKFDVTLPSSGFFCGTSADTIAYEGIQGSSVSWLLQGAQIAADTQRVSVASSGDLIVEVTYGMASVRDTATISGLLQPSITLPADTVCQDSSKQFAATNTAALAQYTWQFGNGDTAAGVNASYAYSDTGSYTLTLEAQGNGCTTQQTASLVVEQCVVDRPNRATALQQFRAYPNPTRGRVTLALQLSEPQAVRVQLRDLQGRTLRSFRLQGSAQLERSLSLRGLPAGLYLLDVQGEDFRAHRKLRKQ